MIQAKMTAEYVVRSDLGESITCTEKILKSNPPKTSFECTIEKEHVPDINEMFKMIEEEEKNPSATPSFPPIGAFPLKKETLGKFDDVIVRPTKFKNTSGKVTTIPVKGSDDIARCVIGMNGTRKTLACYSPQEVGESLDPYVMGGAYYGPGDVLPLTFKQILALKP